MHKLVAALASVLIPTVLVTLEEPASSGVGVVGPELNVIVVVVDDMDDFSCAETASYLPASSPWLLDRGRCFENATVTSPACCPARASLMTGQVPHNNGVRRQIDGTKLDPSHTIQARLSDLGRTTYGVGKYLNAVDPGKVMSGRADTGFDRTDIWNTDVYEDLTLYDHQGHAYHPNPPVHPTVLAGGYLRGFVSEMTSADKPFYAYVGFAAPHTQNRGGEGFLFPAATATNARRPVPRFRYHPERDTSDKLLPFATGVEKGHGKKYFTRFQAARVRSLYDVDDQVAATFRILEQNHALDHTAVFFVSDNGYQLGSNGWEGKAVPYPDSLEVPMLAYYPPAFGSGVVDRRPVSLIDIASTIYDLVGTTADHQVDGHSLLSPASRSIQFHEFTNERSKFVLAESGHAPFNVPTWSSYVDEKGHQYIEYYRSNGKLMAAEYYTDKRREKNLLDPQYAARRPKAAKLRGMRARLHALESCAGTVEQGAPNPCP